MAVQRSTLLGIGVATVMVGALSSLMFEQNPIRAVWPALAATMQKAGLSSGQASPASAPAATLPAGAPAGGAPKQAQGGPGGPPGAGAPPPAVTVAKPLVRRIVEWDEYTGRFDAVESVEVRARVSGYLNEVHFKDGEIVKRGDPLYTIDPRPFERALEQAKAELGQASTKVENTSLDVERGKPLVDRKIMSEKVFDDRANAMRDAQASMRVAEAKVKTAELDLLFTKVTAPVSGKISRSSVTAGSWVSGGAAANSTSLTSIVSESPIHIYFDIPENNWIKYRRMIDRGTKQGAAQIGSSVEIALPDESGFPHKGRVDFLDNRLDQATGTLRGRALVENPKGTFSPGMFARVRVQGSDEYDAVMLPDDAIGTDQTNRFVLTVADDGTVGRKPITLGPLIDGFRVIRTGLTASDTIIIKGLQRARPGAKVTPRREELKAAQASGPTGAAQGGKAPPAKTQ